MSEARFAGLKNEWDFFGSKFLYRVVIRVILLTFILCAQTMQSAWAGGSFSVDEEFAAIKAQIPALWRVLNNAFELESSGYANMIGNNVNEHLGHKRIGPYCLMGKPKGQSGINTLQFCFNTNYHWQDAKGQKTDMEKAVEVREEFLSLEITPLKN